MSKPETQTETEQETKYEMSLSLNVLNHLGLNLYSNVPAVLSEAVANAWDADAEHVDVDIHPDEDPLHRSQALSEKNLERIQQSEPGGTWRDWDNELVLDCHKKDSGSTYNAVYGRMEWDSAAPTITTQFYGYGSGRFGHPEQDRAISLREGAMLQTFPKDYCFVEEETDEVSFKQIGRFIGNAVPVRIAEVIGESILQHLDNINVTDGIETRDGGGNAVRDVSQPQRTESSGAESLQ